MAPKFTTVVALKWGPRKPVRNAHSDLLAQTCWGLPTRPFRGSPCTPEPESPTAQGRKDMVRVSFSTQGSFPEEPFSGGVLTLMGGGFPTWPTLHLFT